MLREANRHGIVGHRPRPGLHDAEATERVRERERPIHEMPGCHRRRIGDGQRRVAGRRGHQGRRRRAVGPIDPRRNAPKVAGVPSVSESVAGTVPPTPPPADVPCANVTSPGATANTE